MRSRYLPLLIVFAFAAAAAAAGCGLVDVGCGALGIDVCNLSQQLGNGEEEDEPGCGEDDPEELDGETICIWEADEGQCEVFSEDDFRACDDDDVCFVYDDDVEDPYCSDAEVECDGELFKCVDQYTVLSCFPTEDGIAPILLRCEDDAHCNPAGAFCENDDDNVWTCPLDWLGDDSCDCGCGVPDPDCSSESINSCGWCGACTPDFEDDGACPGEVRADDPTSCQ